MTRRVGVMLIFFIVIFAVLSGRLYYIQIMCREELSAGAEGQQVIQIQSRENRGVIFDRNLVRMTNTGSSYYYLLSKEKNNAGLEALMAKIQGKPAGAKGEDYVVYKSEIFRPEVNRRLIEDYQAYVFGAGNRYENDQIAAHLIGYVSNGGNIGVSGLEEKYQYRLSESKTDLFMMGNGIGEPIRGLGITQKTKKDKVEVSGLVTTIDSGLQRFVEKTLREKRISGAAVVTDVESGQILAMASTPTFNPNQLEQYLAKDNGELMNKTISGQYPPGSVFKIVVAAAAMESGKAEVGDRYTCTGSIVVNGVTLICEGKRAGHGDIDLLQAFAQSCNCYFAHLGTKLGAETIVEMADRLGMGKVVLDNFPGEEEGNFPSEEERAFSGLSNLSIGQGSLLVTPIQIAKMTNIIAAGGVDFPLSLVIDDEGRLPEGRRVMSAASAEKVGEMMKEVMVTGTGAAAGTHVPAAGKTGSAEASLSGTETVHGWFTGYFPADNPRYSVTVLAENGKTGGGSALPVFVQIVNYLY